MKNHFSSKINRLVIALTGVLVLSIGSAYAGTAYTNGRAFLKQGSPTGGGKVYVASNATEPTSGQYKAVTSSTSPAFNVQVAGDATFNYWAVANPGYIFTGWYTAEGALQSSGAAHISKKVTAGQAGASDTHAYADYYASFIKQIQLSFVVPTNGSFTITHCGTEVTPAYSSFTTEGKVVLTALPADGYKLRGWYTTTNGGVTKNYFAFGNSCEPNFTSNTTIGAEFVPDDGKATFWIKGTNQIYDNLTSANTAAASSSSKLIVVVSDGVVGAGTYTISSGVTLLIPYEETYNLMTTPNIKHIPSPNAASKVTSIFRKLTLASGATINVSGNICIGGSIASCNGGSPSSFPTGSVGMLDMSRGGTINLASGSNLYAWGYVKGQDMDQGNNTAASGVGEINAASGATVWEDYQVGEWRGGTASSTIYSNKGSWKFFPFQSYTIQNIEAPVNYAYGSNCKCYWTIFGNGSVYDVKFPLIASSGSLFQLKSGGTVRKWYDPTTDHVCFEMGGTAALDALTLTVMGETVSSSDYYLPIPANLKIILKSGNNLTVSKPMTMHAGSVVEIKSGATLTVNNRVHLFDADDWDTYCMYAYYYRTYYSPSLHFNRGEGTAKTTLEDATVIVDGTVDVKGAYLYSSAHGSNICGNGGGTFKYAALPSNTTMTQCKVLKDNVSVNIRSANLHNDNDTYTKGIASTTFKNVNGRWFTNAASTIKANKTYDFTYISSGDVYGTGGTNKTVAACWSKDKTGLELQDKWANIKTQGCTDWWEGIDDGHLYNWSRNSAWHQYIKTGSTTTGSGEEAVTTDTYVGSDGKMLYKTDCEFVDAGTIDGNCLYPSNKALVNGSLIAVTANTSPDHGYHKSDAASTYYLCFEGCVWHPATKNAENLYTVDGTKYIWYGDKWMAVEYDSGVSLHYSLSATNVKIYYEYVGSAWVLATPVAEVVTSAGTEQVFSLANAITKAKAGGTNVTIRLLKNISGTISYDGTNNCGLDLNGFTLSSSTSGMITVNSATATFIIKDQSAAGTGKVQLSYSANTRRYAISVTKGHLVVNSGTISAINTSAYASGNTTVDVGAITVANGHKVTVNGGSIEAISDHNPYGIYLAGATAMATINGGTIEAKTTERSSSVDSPYGIIGAGSIYVNGGTVKATCYRSSSSRGISSSGTFTMTGGSVIATASSTCYGVYAASGSNTTISGGTVTSTTTGGTARALISYATATVSGGTLTATAGGSDAKGIYVAGGTTTVNTGATVSASATTNAYGIYYADGTPTVTVNGGAFTVSTTSTTGAYGVYAAKGTGTINDGTFTVTAKTTGAEGMHVETTNTPKLTLNGGKFMVKNSNGSADGTINNTGATLANFSMAGGYFNIAPNGTTNIAAGKSVQDVDRTKEQAIYDAGYVKKIRGNEYTVTWKDHAGNVIGTSQVESGKVPVWTGGEVNCSDANSTREHNGWSTAAWNGGTSYVFPTALPAIAASDVTYFAHYNSIYAEVIAGGTTTRYNSAQTAWTQVLKNTQATIRILSNLGTESSVGNMTQLVFNPSNANSIITLDLNGHSWTMGNHATASENKDIFLDVNPTQANCKLIITDNSASGNGYLLNKWNRSDGVLHCARVVAGELILQGGGLRVNNTGANAENKKYSVCVQVNGSTQFTMTGGMVYATDAYSPRGINVSPNGNANIVGGTVHADATGGNAYTTLAYGTISVGGDALVKATTAGSGAYPGYADGGTLTVADSCSIVATAPSGARGFYALQGGKITVNDKPTITATVTSGSEAYGCYVSGSGSEIEVNGGTYELTGAAASGSVMGVRAISSGVATINNGTFTLQGGNNWTFGVFAQTGTVNINGGNFTVSQASGGNKEGIRVYPGGTCNVTGGTFTVTTIGSTGGNALHAYGGTTNISGNPVFNAHYGVTVADGVVANGATTATVVIDGGTYNTQSFAVNSKNTSRDDAYYTGTNTGDVTVWDGKFKSQLAGYNVLDNSSSSSCLKIRGGWYSNNSSGKIATGSGNYVVSPSTVKTLTSSDQPEYGDGYRYHVLTKYNVTWSVNGNTTVQEYNRNETPSYGSTPSIDDGNYYVFTGWSPEIVPVTADATYTAQFTKYEAEVTIPGVEGSKLYESFVTAWNEAQDQPNAIIKLLSNVSLSTQVTLNPTTDDGSKPLTLDLNNHTLQYTGTDDRFIVVSKTGCKLIITDNSLAKGGKVKVDVNRAEHIIGVASHYGDLELQGGEIYVRNSNASAEAWGAYPCKETNFTMTGGTISTYARANAKGVYTEWGSTPTVTISGGSVLASTEYDNSGTPAWGNNAYGVYARKGGKITISGTASITAHANQDAYAAFASGNGGVYGEISIKGGTVTAIVETKRVFGAYADIEGKIDIEGGAVDGHSNVADVTSMWNVEGAHCAGGAILNISGGEITSSNGASPIGVSVHGGTTTISGGKISSTYALYAVDYAAATQTATVNIHGGTFIATAEAVCVEGKIRDAIKNNANVTVNGGYFYSTGGYLVRLINASGAEPSTLVLNGGKYCEKSGTTYKTQITNLKGGTTSITDINETVDGKTYKYELLTDFNITWLGGSSYSKVTTVQCGTVPTNNELVGKSFIRNDSAFYFTGWTPTPSAVIGEATYNAVGDYHEASVKVGSAEPIIYDDFDEAWSYAMDQTSATITLLSNITRTTSIVYSPSSESARHTFDLNNFTIKENTADRLLIVNKSDAKLTITDNSSEKGGCLYKKMNSSANMYVSTIYHGELILAGGKIYAENTSTSDSWHPAIAVHVGQTKDGDSKFTMTGGIAESQAKYLAYPLYNYCTMNIEGGTIIANATGKGSSLGIYSVNGTATVSGGTFNISASSSAIGALAGGWINGDGSNIQNGTLNITGGTFNVSATSENAHAIQATGTGKNIGGTVYTAHGITNVSGGTFNVTCSATTATQVFAGQCVAWRLFDDALPHNMIGEAKGEMNISGGTFTVDTRDNGAWVENKGNIDLLRNWGTLNVTGGTFTIYQKKYPVGVASYRNKATISGNPVFNINGGTSARGVVAGPWNHKDYCDADASNNLAEIEVNGGTFNVKTTISGDLTLGAWAYGGLDGDSKYAMNAKITVNGGEFICINPTANNSRAFRQEHTRTGTYGSAIAQIFVKGGKFKPLAGTAEPYTSAGTHNVTLPDNNDKRTLLTGGYYIHNTELSTFIADTCFITPITSVDVDPEYNNGYRYRIDVDYQAKVTVGAVERKFALFRDAFEYAKTQNNAKITLLRNINYEGLNFVYNPTTATTCTLDLNGFTFTGAVSGHTGDAAYNNDRLLIISKAGATFTIKDSSVGKTGKFSHEKSGAGFTAIVYHGTLKLESGTVHCKNTSGSAQALRTTDPDAIILVTGGKAHAEATTTAYGLNNYSTSTVSGGEILAESSSGAAYGVYVTQGTTTINGTAQVTANAHPNAKAIYATGSTSNVIVEAGTFNATSVGGSNASGFYAENSACATISGGTFDAQAYGDHTYGVQISGAGTINVTGGTFNVHTPADATAISCGNVEGVRVWQGTSTIVNVSGGTFTISNTSKNPSSSTAIRAFGGTVNVTGNPIFTGSYYGVQAVNTYVTPQKATINVNGGTFSCTGSAIYAGKFTSSDNVNDSEVNIKGGKFKSTNGAMAQDAGGALTISGGYFNEKSGTTFKGQISPYVADTCDLNTLDPLLDGIYKYEVAPHYVAKVQTGSTTKYHTTAKAAFDYAKTVANPTITLLDNCTLTSGGDANYNKFTANSWTGTLDLNGFTLTPTFDGMGRALTVGGTGSKLTIKDSASGGQIYYQGGSTMTLICFVMEGSAEIEWASGTLYVENTSDTYEVNGFVVNSANSKFTQSGGTFTLKGKYRARGYYGSGTVTLTGGTMNVTGETSQAIGLHPNTATSVLNISGTFALNAESDNYAYGVYTQNGTATIEGIPALNVKAPTRARVLQGTGGSTTVNGGLFEANGTTASQSDCYALISEGTSTMTVGGGKFKTNQNNIAYKSTDATLTINGGYFNESSGTNHKTKVTNYKGSGKVVLNLDTDDAEYIAGYRYIVTADPVAKVKVGSEVTYHTTIADAIAAANELTDPTVTMLKDVTTTQVGITATMTIDLNGKTISSTQTTAKRGVLATNADDITLTIRDSGTGGKIDHTASVVGNVYGIYVNKGKLKLEGGTICAKNNVGTDNSSYRTYGIYTPNTNTTGSITISDGTIEAYSPNCRRPLGICAYCDLTMTGGTVIADGLFYARGIYAAGDTTSLTDVTVTANSTDSTSYAVQADAGYVVINSGTYTATAGNKYAYAIYGNASTLTINNGTFTANGESSVYTIYDYTGTLTINNGTYTADGSGDAVYAIVARNNASVSVAINDGKYSGKTRELYKGSKATVSISGGYYVHNTTVKDNCAANHHCLALSPSLTEGGITYNYKVAEAYTLTWNLDGGTVTVAGTQAPVDATGTPSGYVEKGASLTAPTVTKTGYTFAGWSPSAPAATMPAANTTYTATWAVASVTISGTTTLYTTFLPAWTAANTANAASTLTLLQDVTVTSQLTYNNSNNMNCTLDLNGHTLTSNTSQQRPLQIDNTNVTFTVTDGTEEKSGKLSLNSSSSSAIFGAFVDYGTLLLNAGTIEVTSSTATTCGVTANSNGTFTMNGGTIHVKATNSSKEGRGVYSVGSVSINGGTVHVEAAKDGYGIKRDGGTVTVNDGKFNISASGTPYITNQANNTYVKIYGGYYNINTQLGTCVSAPYHVFNLTSGVEYDEGYRYKVARFYTITYNKGANGTGTIAAGYKAKDDNFTLSSSTFTRTGYTQTGWSTTDGGAKVYELGGTYSDNADLTVYPFWSAQNYTLTLNNQSATTAGTTSITVTYNSNTNLTATPAITVPTKTGYTFGGYYVDQGGSGKQVIAANGNVNASVSGITDASKNWIASTGGTIYAKWTQTVTLHDNNGGIHNGSLEVTYNATTKSGTPPTREGYTAEGYYAEPACTNKVLTTAAVWVNYSGWVEGGKWVHDGESTLYTKWIEDTHTVTVAAGANGSASPASVTAGITTPSETITATPNTGYHFVNWTLPDGVTAASTYTASSNPIRINATADDKTITANFAANTNTAYTVKHYKQNLAGDGYDLADTDNLTGTTGASVTPAVKSYTGFTAPSTQTVTILADGSRVVTYNYTRNSYTLAWALDGGSISVAGTTAGSVKYGASLTAPTVTKTGYTFAAWAPAVAATMPAANTTYTATWTATESGSYADIVDVDNANSKLIVNVTSWPVNGWPYSINGVPYAKDAREDDRTLKVTYSGAPGDDFPMLIQKTNGDVYSHHTYVIPQEVKSATALSANETKNLFVKNGANLTVNANIAVKNIYVAPGSKLTINSGKTLTADTIFLRTTAEGAAEMVKNGSIAGTTKLVYTRIIKDKDFHLFGLPLPCPISSVRLSDGLSPAYGTGWLLRSYDEERRANMGADDNNWVSLAAGSTIAGGAGYELFSASNYYREFYFPVSLPTTNKVAVAYTSDGAAGEKQAGWNALVSPFTHTYTNDPAPEDLVVNWYMDGYGYYEQEIPSVIPPAKPFAFQTSEAGYLSFEGSAIAITKMPRRASEEEVQIQWIHLDITDADGIGDQTSVYSHPTRYEAAYQTGIDVAKQSLTAARAILYSSHAYGEMAFAGVADSLLEQGVALTVFSPKPQELTISLRDNRWLDRLAEVWLVDTETGAQIDLFDSDYTFEANEGTTRGRLFLMGRFKAPNIATDIDNTEATEGAGVKAQKLIIRDKMYIRINGQLYDATGKQVNVK